jgi:hypothetical protein
MSPSLSLPPRIEVIKVPDGVRYRLPRRPLHREFRLLLFVLVILIVGVAGACFLCGVVFFSEFVFFFLLVLLGLLVFLGVILIGLVSHAEIELRGDTLWAIERAGFLRRSRWLPVRLLERLVVGHLPRMQDQRSAASSLMELHGMARANEPGLAAILAEYDGGQLMLLAPGYARPWLLALAANLAHHCFRGEWEQELQPCGGPVEVIESVVEASGFCERHNRPAGSSVVLERRSNEVSLLVPPLGLWRGGGCFLLFGLVWLGGALFCLLTVRGDVAEQGIAFLALGGGLLGGLGMLLLGIHCGRRWAVLTVAGKTLSVRTGGLFGDWERSWQREEIEDIRTGHGLTVDDSNRLELQIHLKRFLNPTFSLLAERSADELAWMATVLRHALRLPQAGRRAGLVPTTKADQIQAAAERPSTTSKEDRIWMAKERAMRSTAFRPRRRNRE